VVVNRVRSSAVGDAPGRRVAEALARFASVSNPVLVPDDREACDAAMLVGRTLTESAPRSPARLAVETLAAELRGVAARGSRRSRWRRALARA